MPYSQPRSRILPVLSTALLMFVVGIGLSACSGSSSFAQWAQEWPPKMKSRDGRMPKAVRVDPRAEVPDPPTFRQTGHGGAPEAEDFISVMSEAPEVKSAKVPELHVEELPSLAEELPKPRPMSTPSGDSQAHQIARLESELVSLRADMNRLLPVLRKLLDERKMFATAAGINPVPLAMQDHASAMADASVMTGMPRPLSPQASMAGSAASSPSEPLMPTAQTVRKVRSGEHPGKSRLVLDLDAPSPYQYEIDNARNALIVDLPKAGWNGPESGRFSKSPILQSWSFVRQGGGSRLMIQLKQNAHVLKAMALPPTGPNGYRIMLDLSS